MIRNRIIAAITVGRHRPIVGVLHRRRRMVRRHAPPPIAVSRRVPRRAPPRLRSRCAAPAAAARVRSATSSPTGSWAGFAGDRQRDRSIDLLCVYTPEAAPGVVGRYRHHHQQRPQLPRRQQQHPCAHDAGAATIAARRRHGDADGRCVEGPQTGTTATIVGPPGMGEHPGRRRDVDLVGCDASCRSTTHVRTCRRPTRTTPTASATCGRTARSGTSPARHRAGRAAAAAAPRARSATSSPTGCGPATRRRTTGTPTRSASTCCASSTADRPRRCIAEGTANIVINEPDYLIVNNNEPDRFVPSALAAFIVGTARPRRRASRATTSRPSRSTCSRPATASRRGSASTRAWSPGSSTAAEACTDREAPVSDGVGISAVDFAWTPEQLALRERGSPVRRRRGRPLRPAQRLVDQRLLRGVRQGAGRHGAGSGMTWPVEHGGGGRPAIDRLIVGEELIAAGAPIAAMWFADRQMGPTLIAFGTDDQRPRSCPGSSSARPRGASGCPSPRPAATSPACARPRRARRRRVGDQRAEDLDQLRRGRRLLLPDLPHVDRTVRRTHGISEIVVPMDTPGIEVRPITDMTTNRHFCEVFFTDVRVPATQPRRRRGRRVQADDAPARARARRHRPAGRRTRPSTSWRSTAPTAAIRWCARRSPRSRPATASGASSSSARCCKQAPAGFSAATKCFCTEHEVRVAEFVAAACSAPRRCCGTDVTQRPAVRARATRSWAARRTSCATSSASGSSACRARDASTRRRRRTARLRSGNRTGPLVVCTW